MKFTATRCCAQSKEQAEFTLNTLLRDEKEERAHGANPVQIQLMWFFSDCINMTPNLKNKN